MNSDELSVLPAMNSDELSVLPALNSDEWIARLC